MSLSTLPAAYRSLSQNDRYHTIVEQLDAACRELRSTAHNLMPEILLEDGAAQAVFIFAGRQSSPAGS